MNIGLGIGIPFSRSILYRALNTSLYLDFVSNETLDPKISFSRASNATVTKSDGTIGYAPHNLLTYSEQFDNAAWAKSNATVTANAVIAPDGTLTADKLIESATTTTHYVRQFPTISGAYSFSVYAKAAERTYLQLDMFDSTNGPRTAIFNLSTGVVTSVTASVASAVIASVGNGWYRCTLNVTASASGGDAKFGLYNGSSASYAGDGYSGLYIWGAQLNVGALQPYYPTTVKNLLGYTQEFDNAAWTKSNSFVQTNQIRNNTMQGAVAGTPGTDPANWSVAGTANGITKELVGTGTEDGIPYVDVKYSGTPSAGTNVAISFEPPNQVIAASGQTWTESVFLKLQAGSFNATTTTLSLLGTDGTSGTENFQSSSITSTPTSLKDGRLVVTGTFALITTTRVQPRIRIGYTVGTPIDLTLRIGLPQLVQGAVAGDPVATYGTTRAVMYAAPDGTMTADKLVEDTANSTHFVRQTPTGTVNTSPMTLTVYAKAGERSNMTFAIQEGSPFARQSNVVFDLLAGTVTTPSDIGGASASSASITPVGNGWYRCRLTTTLGGSATSLLSWIYVRTAASLSYTGDGTSGIYIWGAQLSDSASLDPYVYNPGAAPAASAYYGPRFDYDPVTLQPKGLLIEEQRTNSIRNNTMVGAVAGTPGTLPTNWSYGQLSTLTTEIIGSGVETGIDYVDIRISGTATTTALVYFEANSTIAATNAQAWATSVFVKRVGGSETNASNFGTTLRMSSSTGTNLGFVPGSVLTLPSSAASLSACRFSSTHTTNNASTAFVMPAFAFNTTGGVNITLRIGLPQLEQGAFATSVIPTTTAAATRAADGVVMTGANFSSWYRQDEGTLFADATSSLATGYIWTLMRAGVGYGPRIQNTLNGVNVSYGAVVDNAGAVIVSFTRSGLKSAFALKTDDYALSANGGSVITDNSGAIPTEIAQLRLGIDSVGGTALNGHIRRIAYFPRRLSNAELQGITA